MGVGVGVVMVVVGVVWAASVQSGHGLQRATPPHESPRWALLSNTPTGYGGKTWEEPYLPEADEDLHASWDYPAWLEDLVLQQQPRRRSLAEVLAPLAYPVHKRARVPAAGGEGTGAGDGEEEGAPADATSTSSRRKSRPSVGRAAKRGIGLFSLAIALAQKPTSPPEPKMHPADLSAYPRRARFFVATMG
ncbi:uncharacterized protein [Panulirus ornatus]|uniref:uncharacterized protein n=1 Tax=Panulirus ornatus TaxID=150431 RepID=UPI003A8B512D